MSLTQTVINEVAGLLAHEDNSIWEIGDRIYASELTRDEVAVLADEVDRSFTTLWNRARLAEMFPATDYDRSSAPIGVFEQLSRLDNPLQRQRLLAKKTWTVNAIRKEIDRKLMDKLPPLPPPRDAVRVTRYDMGDLSVAMKSTLTPDGDLSIMLPGSLAAGTEIDTEVDNDGRVHINIKLDVGSLEDPDNPSHLRVVK